ncbi:uncharacterized protein LOC128555888 [Mercenaria mercenaria]|uniref:uncharacterized protein LOC128555888 n=1 Tax=Mercenaria mercenaria TaxID=6596 RepID=UPI00234EB9B9|nr:uncharacterized protein LOC128555888 [Mercenaria mercenaria]
MSTCFDDITRGHELYLRHLLLLGQAAPLALKAVIEREVRKRGESLAQLIGKKKDTFNVNYRKQFLQLFQDDEVKTNTDSWDTSLLCVVTFVLFKSYLTSTALQAVTCVSDQRKDLDNYAHSASLNFKTFETKWVPLNSAMLELIKDIDDEAKFECKRMIHSFKSESIKVNIELINKMKQINDVNLHVQMAIQDKVAPNIHGEAGNCDQNEPVELQKVTKMMGNYRWVGHPPRLHSPFKVTVTIKRGSVDHPWTAETSVQVSEPGVAPASTPLAIENASAPRP